MRTIYEVLLRHNPVKRPYLIGVVGNDENGKKVMDYHKQMGDKLEGVRISNGKTTQICGIYSKEGLCEKEYRLKDTIEGVEVNDIETTRFIPKAAINITLKQIIINLIFYELLH